MGHGTLVGLQGRHGSLLGFRGGNGVLSGFVERHDLLSWFSKEKLLEGGFEGGWHTYWV